MTELATIGSQSTQWKGSVQKISSGLAGIGIDAEPVRKAVAALTLFTGLAQGAAAVQGLIEMYHTLATAEAVAETSARALEGPPGWAIIGAAAGAAVASAAVFGTIARELNISGNFENPSEAKLAAITAGVA